MQLKNDGNKETGDKKPFFDRRKAPAKGRLLVKLKSDKRVEAEKIAQRSGIPLPDACRVVAGQTTVNDV
ncbi:MAG: hypothetical protein FJ088_01085, partial [Deltaproteobacteria bacterium]|nr:hypothetical protein [Deltaproteobacteria bacterium]